MMCWFKRHKFKKTHNYFIGGVIAINLKCTQCHKKMMLWLLVNKGESREKGIRIHLI